MIVLISIYRAISRYIDYRDRPNNRLTCMQGKKTLSLSNNMHLFLPYLLNDSQTIRSTMNFSKPLLCVTLICGDWSIGFIFISSRL